MSEKLTPWYPPEIKPVHVGAYDIAHEMFSAPWFAYWDGKEWSGVGISPNEAEKPPLSIWFDSPIRQDFSWRGRVKP